MGQELRYYLGDSYILAYKLTNYIGWRWHKDAISYEYIYSHRSKAPALPEAVPRLCQGKHWLRRGCIRRDCLDQVSANHEEECHLFSCRDQEGNEQRLPKSRRK